MKVIYTAEAHVTGGRFVGRGRTRDGQVDIRLRMPDELGGPGDGANPEQLMAIGWAAFFEATLATAAHRHKISMKSVDDAEIDARVMLMVPAPEAGEFGVGAEFEVTLPSIPDHEPVVDVRRGYLSDRYVRGVTSMVVAAPNTAVTPNADVALELAVAAVAALLLAPKAAPQPTGAPGYEAYVDYYNQAVRSYYSQQGQPAEQSERAGYGQAYADARAAARPQRSQWPSQHGDYADLDYSGTRTTAPQHDSAGSAAGPTGLPSFGQARTSADQPLPEAEQSAQPSSPG